jgi:hypothetical protein
MHRIDSRCRYESVDAHAYVYVMLTRQYLIKYLGPEREREYLKTFFEPVGNRTQAARL